jgi:hypothetical protein
MMVKSDCSVCLGDRIGADEKGWCKCECVKSHEQKALDLLKENLTEGISIANVKEGHLHRSIKNLEKRGYTIIRKWMPNASGLGRHYQYILQTFECENCKAQHPFMDEAIFCCIENDYDIYLSHVE